MRDSPGIFTYIASTMKEHNKNSKTWRPAPKYDSCFVCGESNPEGLNLTFQTADSRAITTWKPREEHCGYKGVVHGGISATILDEAMGWAGWRTFAKNFFTAELTIRYRKPVTTGREYRIETEMTKSRGKFYTAIGKIIAPDGEILVEGEGKYFVRDDV